MSDILSAAKIINDIDADIGKMTSEQRYEFLNELIVELELRFEAVEKERRYAQSDTEAG